MMIADWKKHHSDEARKAVDHEVVQEVMQEYADNMCFKLEGLPRYGLMKVAVYAASVARAQALGFDPDLLRLDDSEANEVMLKIAEAAATRGVPVWLLGPEAEAE